VKKRFYLHRVRRRVDQCLLFFVNTLTRLTPLGSDWMKRLHLFSVLSKRAPSLTNKMFYTSTLSPLSVGASGTVNGDCFRLMCALSWKDTGMASIISFPSSKIYTVFSSIRKSTF